MYDLVDLYGKIKPYQSAKSVDMAIAALAEKLGAKREAIEMADVPIIKYHGRVGAHLMHDMLLGNVAANTDEQIEAAFKNLHDIFLHPLALDRGLCYNTRFLFGRIAAIRSGRRWKQAA